MNRSPLSLVSSLAFALTAISCAKGGPTGPEEAKIPPVIVRDRPDLQQWSESTWGKVARCVGASETSVSGFPVIVEPDWFMCGSIKAVGCMDYWKIRATEYYQGLRYYEGVFQHEASHLAMWKKFGRGRPDDHKEPLFLNCANVGLDSLLSAEQVRMIFAHGKVD